MRAPAPSGLLAHAKSSRKTEQASVISRASQPEPIEFISSSQIASCRAKLGDASYGLLFELMVRVGLRSCEARTFPAAYVVNPKLTDYAQASYVPVALDPRHMYIKGGKFRTVHVPRTLMEDLWAYVMHERNRRIRIGQPEPTACILSQRGQAFARQSVVDIFVQLSEAVDFYVRGHMLRHTYATFTLYRLRRSKTFKGDPLVYLRDRLGHSELKTTERYLHIVEQLEGALLDEHNKELDGLWADRLLDGEG